MISSRSACVWALLLTGGASAQILDNRTLTGKYYFRQLFVTSDGSGNVTETRSLLGAITFDGNGGYTFTGQQNVGSAAAAALSGFGTYTVSSAGLVNMPNPMRSSLSLNARYSAEAVVGSSTENTSNVFDL